MSRVCVVTDSTADMDEEEATGLGITLVPLTVRWGAESYLDKVELSLDEFYDKLKSMAGIPQTSQPSVGAFETSYRRLLEDHEGIVSVHLSSRLSGTVNAARMAASRVAPDRIAVLDSLTTSFPLGYLALQLARSAAKGASLVECVRVGEDLIPRLRLFCILDTLEHLRRGGRIGRVQTVVGSLLSIKPIVYLNGGEVLAAERVRTRSGAVRRTVELVRALGPIEEAAVLYGDNPDGAVELRSALSREYPGLEVKWGRTGAVIGTHTGPGVFAAFAILAGCTRRGPGVRDRGCGPGTCDSKV